MSKQAEQKAIERYPITAENGERAFLARGFFIQGYEQAEKDLILTWIDVRNILSIAREVEDENDDCLLLKYELCDETLRRFNEQKKK